MPRLTDQGLQRINDLAQHYGVSADAVMTLLQALLNSKGTMAQFDHRELGGAGQWMPGGMTMVGDMFNHGLKAKVDGLCSELSQILAMQPFVPFPAGLQSQSQRQGGGQQEGGHDVLDTGRRSGSTQPYGFDFLVRLDSFAVRNLAGTTLLTMNLFRPFPLHDRARQSIAKMGCKPKAAMDTLQNAREQWEFLAASPI